MFIEITDRDRGEVLLYKRKKNLKTDSENKIGEFYKNNFVRMYSGKNW